MSSPAEEKPTATHEEGEEKATEEEAPVEKPRTLTLASADGNEFEADARVMQLSKLIKEMTETGDLNEIPLPKVKTAVLVKVIEFCKHHAEEELPIILTPLRSTNLKELMPDWYVDFITEDVDLPLLFDIISTADYMDIKPLLDLSCSKLASHLMGKSPEEIKKFFGVEKEITEEDMNRIKEENPWIYEV